MEIDCGRCEMRGTGCQDCVVTALEPRRVAGFSAEAPGYLDEAEVKPYFALENMIGAAFDTAGRLFGVSFAERTDLALYHDDVRVYEVRDGDGRHVGLFLHDNFARPGKRSGAWMSSYRDQESFEREVTPRNIALLATRRAPPK